MIVLSAQGWLKRVNDEIKKNIIANKEPGFIITRLLVTHKATKNTIREKLKTLLL
jgi:P2-related tail formation protein